MKAIQLRTEYLKNPLGIDIIKPRLMWKCSGGKKQTAYRVVVTCGGAIVWDSGRVESASMHTDMPVELKSRMRLAWTVTLWDEEGKEDAAEEVPAPGDPAGPAEAGEEPGDPQE